MRVEQRIGRIDRLGQKFARIRIVNLHYEDTVEAAVYKVLRERIGMFINVVGRLQPILSQVAGQIARAVLLKSEAAATETIVEGIHAEAAQVEQAPFDLDSLLSGDPIEGDVTPALYDLGELGRILKDHQRLLPEANVNTRSDKEAMYQNSGNEDFNPYNGEPAVL